MIYYLLSFSRSELEDISKYASLLFIIGIAVLILMFIFTIIKGSEKAKNLKSDNEKPAVVIIGKVLEKKIDNSKENWGFAEYKNNVEWIIFEDAAGIRRRVRNTDPDHILISAGDTGKLTVRGETIYGFERDKK
ncbi:MAG: hypothetical protein J6M16_06300 [Clostridia bacterium]|nr:hypothetical protein [Clostridia bacterium]